MSDHDQRTIKEALSTYDDEVDGNDDLKTKIERKKRDRNSDRLNNLEEKVSRFESQLNAFNQIPSNSELIDRTRQISKTSLDDDRSSKQQALRHGPILEIWQYTQLEKRLESAESGITRVDISDR